MAGLLAAVHSEIIKAYTAQDVNDVIAMNKGKIIALFFINPHVNIDNSSSEQKTSFWDSILGVIDSIKGIFVSSEMDAVDIEE